MKFQGMDKILLMSARAKGAANAAAIDDHVAGTADQHAAEKITYNGSVTGATDVKQGIDLLKARVDEIITTPISGEGSAQELVDARGGFGTLGARLSNSDATLLQKADTSLVNDNYEALDTKINSLASGAPAGVYATLVALEAAIPAGDENIYIVAADGHWYYWSGSAWTDGGVYQATELINGSVASRKTNFVITGKNLFNKDTAVFGYWVNYTNGVYSSADNYYVSDYILVAPSTQYSRKFNASINYYDAQYNWISGALKSGLTFTTPANCYYIRINIQGNQAEGQIYNEQVELGATSTYYEPFGYGFVSTNYFSKLDMYPFQPKATFSTSAIEKEIRNAVKKIEVYGADLTKKYCLGIIQRNYSIYGTGAYIYECDPDTGATIRLVATTSAVSYTEPKGVDEFSLAMSGANGVTAKLWVDWSKITTGSQYINQHYDKSGLDERTYTPIYLSKESLEIKLPPTVHAIVGSEVNIYFENCILCDNLANYQIDVTCNIGTQQNDRWTCIPSAAGTSALIIDVYKDFMKIASATTSIVVKAATVGNGVNRKCLFIGDSTTAGGDYSAELLVLQNADVMKLTLLGTIGTAPNVHEGRGGWTISKYLEHADSPFVYNGAIDFAQYMADNSYSGLNYVGIHLGINDMFSYVDDIPLNAAITTAIGKLEDIIDNIHAYDANVKVGVMVTIPPSFNQDAFGKNYASNQTRWRYRRNNFLFVKQLIAYFSGKTAQGIYLVPINLNLDTKNNMATETVAVNSRNSTTVVRQSNGVHPANSGYLQIADAIWYWLKSFES